MISSLKSRLSACISIGGAFLLVLASAAQAPPAKSTAAAPPPHGGYPMPVNLKVLPKNLNGQQVHDIMEQWSAELGVRCIACHHKLPAAFEQTDQPTPTYAQDSKQMKQVARLMYTMTDQINTNFIAKVEGSGMPVTCGTCHRGNISPDPFLMPSPPAVKTKAP